MISTYILVSDLVLGEPQTHHLISFSWAHRTTTYSSGSCSLLEPRWLGSDTWAKVIYITSRPGHKISGVFIPLNLSSPWWLQRPRLKTAVSQDRSCLVSWVTNWRAPTDESCPTCTSLWHKWMRKTTTLISEIFYFITAGSINYPD